MTLNPNNRLNRKAALAASEVNAFVAKPGSVQARFCELTPRECEVIDALAEGLPYKGIGDKLKISVNTVNNHLATIRAKFRAHSAIEVLRIYKQF